MNQIVFQLDRSIDPGALRQALARAMAVTSDQVSLITDEQFENGAAWLPPTADVGAKTTIWRGDFPVEVDVFLSRKVDVRAVLHVVSKATGAIVLTDQFTGSSPSGTVWLLITPHGEERIVHGEPEAFADEDDPGIVLLPESRATYEAVASGRATPAAI